MVSVPVSIYTATDDKRKALPVHQYHTECKTRIKKPSWCPECAEMVEKEGIVKGYELNKTDFVPLTDEDYNYLRLESLASINIEAFVASGELDGDPRRFVGSYYLAPDEVGAKAFVLFREAMEEAGVVGIAKMTLREKEQLVCLRPHEGLILLQTLHWADELRDCNELIPFASVAPQEKEMALSLVRGMTKQNLDLGQYHDEWRDAFIELVQAKLEGKELVMPEAKAPKADVDLAAQLLASLNALTPVA